MIVGWVSLGRGKVRKFICKLIRFVDEDRQALRTNIEYPALELHGE